MKHRILVKDRYFVPYVPYERLEKAIDAVAARINHDFKHFNGTPIILCVLNGSILFTGELMKRLDFPCEFSSIRLSSYEGTLSTGVTRKVLGLTSSIKGRTVIVVEDIVDTGKTITDLHALLLDAGAADVKICTMLLKPEVYKKDLKLDYVAMEIENRFIVGFGLDYDQLGRNSKDIYILDTNPPKSMRKHFLIFGPPGAGKGTQAAKLIERFGLRHVSTGDLLRREIATGTPLGQQAKTLIDQGLLVPDEVVEGMIASELDNNPDVRGFIFDACSRWPSPTRRSSSASVTAPRSRAAWTTPSPRSSRTASTPITPRRNRSSPTTRTKAATGKSTAWAPLTKCSTSSAP